MHGLINRSIQHFTRDTYGDEIWAAVAEAANIGVTSFEAMLYYDDQITLDLIATLAKLLDKSKDTVLEDLGTYLVSHPSSENLRRLLRFGGVDYLDFLHSLDDLADRAKLAVPDLDAPQLELLDAAQGQFTLICRSDHPEFAPVLIGVLRAMADDYGALVFLDPNTTSKECSMISVTLLDDHFATGKSFELAAKTA